jgi:hypothetical protein
MGQSLRPPRHSQSARHFTSFTNSRYHLGMLKDEAELAPFEEHLLACAGCTERAQEAADYVDAMRVGTILGGFDLP